jgi:hypothetical protein
LLEVSGACKIPANCSICALTHFPAFHEINSGCCTVAARTQPSTRRAAHPYASRRLTPLRRGERARRRARHTTGVCLHASHARAAIHREVVVTGLVRVSAMPIRSGRDKIARAARGNTALPTHLSTLLSSVGGLRGPLVPRGMPTDTRSRGRIPPS